MRKFIIFSLLLLLSFSGFSQMQEYYRRKKTESFTLVNGTGTGMAVKVTDTVTGGMWFQTTQNIPYGTTVRYAISHAWLVPSAGAGAYVNLADSTAGTGHYFSWYDGFTGLGLKVNIADSTGGPNHYLSWYDGSLLAPKASPTFTGTVGGVDLDFTGNMAADSAIIPGLKAWGNTSTALTMYMTQGNTHTCTLTGNATITLVGGVSGGSYTILITHENSSTSYTLAFSPQVYWTSAISAMATANANYVAVIKLIGSTWFGSFSGPHATAQ